MLKTFFMPASLRVASLSLLLMLPQLLFAQFEDSSNPVYVRSKWKLVKNDSITVIRDSLSHRLDTVFFSGNDPDDPEQPGHFFGSDYRIISIVGSYLSYEYNYNGSGGLHPIGGSWYRTIKIDTREEVSLDDLFTSESIMSVLLSDTNFTKHTENRHPKDLSDFVSSLYGGCEIRFEDLLVSYAITSVDKDVVKIEFGLTHGCEVMRGNFTTIDIVLPNQQFKLTE